ncbi:hypothetical protein [Actibacterium sp.]|uniref:hypothetical protein n=1 Tax=Actibacterium sp. TaxID=1872125 RepID=UPI003564BC32
MWRAACLIWLAALTPAHAQSLLPLPYEQVEAGTRGRIDFSTLPDKPYPGYNLDQGYAFDGGLIGQHFSGQSVEALAKGDDLFDALGPGAATAPLKVEMGPPGQTLSISLHRVFGSNALYPLGPTGQPQPDARGEGMVSILFHRDICRFGLKVHTEYLDDLGTNAEHRGAVELRFLARDGDLIAAVHLDLPGGVSHLGFETADGAASVAGVQVLNRDKGGISIDDIRFGCLQNLS